MQYLRYFVKKLFLVLYSKKFKKTSFLDSFEQKSLVYLKMYLYQIIFVLHNQIIIFKSNIYCKIR